MSGDLLILAGLPGSGKSTIAVRLARKLGACWLRIDTIEQALRDLCSVAVEGEGYELAYRLAADNLRVGNTVIADSCNPIQLTRDLWRQVGDDHASTWFDVEIVCSDPIEHRRRVENREVAVDNLVLPDWDQVVNREYHPWDRERLVIDTADRQADDCVAEVLRLLAR